MTSHPFFSGSTPSDSADSSAALDFPLPVSWSFKTFLSFALAEVLPVPFPICYRMS